MALRMCPQCKQNVSDITGKCPVCEYSFAVTQLDFSRKAPVQQRKKVDLSKAVKHPILLIISIAVVIYGLTLLAKGNVLLCLLMLVIGWFLMMIAFIGASSNAPVKKKCCARCGSENLTFSVQYEQQILGSTSETRKKSIITRAGNDIGRASMIMATGGLWALTPKRSKYKEIQKFKTRDVKHKMAVCQDCGFSWEMLW